MVALDWSDGAYLGVLFLAGSTLLALGLAQCMPPPRLVGSRIAVYPLFAVLVLFGVFIASTIASGPWIAIVGFPMLIFLGFLVAKLRQMLVGRMFIINTSRRDLVPDIADIVTKEAGVECTIVDNATVFADSKRRIVLAAGAPANGLSLRFWDPPTKNQVDAIDRALRSLKPKSRMRDIPQIAVAMVLGCSVVLIFMVALLEATNWGQF